MLRLPQRLPSFARLALPAPSAENPTETVYAILGTRARAATANPRLDTSAPVLSKFMLQCVRGTCTELATAGLGYDIARTMAWIYDLDAATMAGANRNRDVVVPLCPTHANRIRVPQGWDFQDQRQDQRVALPEPAEVPPDAAEPLFAPRSRPEPETFGEPEPEAQPSLLERAFRAAPARDR